VTIYLFQELEKFLRTMTALALADDFAGGDLQGGEQRGGSVTDVIVGLVGSGTPGRKGSTGRVRSRACTWLFSSRHSTTA